MQIAHILAWQRKAALRLNKGFNSSITSDNWEQTNQGGVREQRWSLQFCIVGWMLYWYKSSAVSTDFYWGHFPLCSTKIGYLHSAVIFVGRSRRLSVVALSQKWSLLLLWKMIKHMPNCSYTFHMIPGCFNEIRDFPRSQHTHCNTIEAHSAASHSDMQLKTALMVFFSFTTASDFINHLILHTKQAGLPRYC